MFWLRNKKINFQLHTLIWGPQPPPRWGRDIHVAELNSAILIVYFDFSNVPTVGLVPSQTGQDNRGF